MSWLTGSRPAPFNGNPKKIYHGAHHKMGTVWLMRVLEKVATEFDWRLQKSNQDTEPPDPQVEIFFSNHSLHWPQFQELHGDAAIGSHLVRDPRDAIVSGYYYHLWTDEAWARVPQTELNGLSYQQHLQSLSRSDGIFAEIRRVADYVNEYQMNAWVYSDPRMLELRYEDLIADEKKCFTQLFSHYGFDPKTIRQAVRLAKTQSFRRASARKLGQTQQKSHLRSGKPGEWKDVLSAAHLSIINELFGELMERMGYV